MSAISAAAMRVRTMADGSLRIEVEVEPQDAQQAFALFGRPGAPMALAALVEGHAAVKEPEKPKRSRMGPLQEWAVYRCKEGEFQGWISGIYDRAMGGSGAGFGDVTPERDFGGSLEKYARHCVLVLADVNSRKELDVDHYAGQRFKAKVMRPYMKHIGVTA